MTAPPAFPPSRILLTDAVKKSDAAHKARPSSSQAATPESIEQTKGRVSEAYGQLPISFEVNRGQTDESVKFLARGRGYNLFLTATEAVLSLRKESPRAKGDNHLAGKIRGQEFSLLSHATSQTSTLRMKLVGANVEAEVTGQEQLPGKINYFKGRDASKWQTDIANYTKVKYQGVYPGVDLVYYLFGARPAFFFRARVL